MSQSSRYEITLEQVKPFLSSVVIDYDCRPNWGSHDYNWVRRAMDLTGFKDFKVVCWEDGHADKKWEYDCEVDRFLMDDCRVSRDGVFITEDDGRYYHQIVDYAKVRDRLDEVIRVSYVLADKDILISEGAVNKLAQNSFEEMLSHHRFSQVAPNNCTVTLTPSQWENVCRMKSPQSFKSNAHRQYVHDPWVIEEIGEAIVWDVEVWQWEGNRHWTVRGKCVFIKEGTKPQYKYDYPMDYWD